MSENKSISTKAKITIAAVSGAVLGGIIVFIILKISGYSWHPSDNTGLEGTWYKLVFYNEINFKGGTDGFDMILALGSLPQNECNNIKDYRDVSDGKSVRLYDEFHPDAYLPEGMKVYLYWGKSCNSMYPDNPYGVITVPANVTEVRVPRLNVSSENYEAFNIPSGDRKLNGHVYGVRWSIPD